MPRPLRIEFEHASYHVMNRGAGRQTMIYTSRASHQLFIELLKNAQKKLTVSKRGQLNIPRKITIYACRLYTKRGLKLGFKIKTSRPSLRGSLRPWQSKKRGWQQN